MSIVFKVLKGLLATVKWLSICLLGFSVILVGVFKVAELKPVKPGGEFVPSLLLKNVHIVDVETGQLLRDRSVHIENSSIKAIFAASENDSLTGVRSIDGKGQYLMPGLWEMHGHYAFDLNEFSSMPAAVANGVLYSRELIGDCIKAGCGMTMQRSRERARKIDAAEMVGPYFTSIGSAAVHNPRLTFKQGEQIESPYLAPTTPEEGRQLARYVKDRGADFIKPYNTVIPEAYFSMVDEAHKLGLKVGGHMPKSLSLKQAIAAGQDSIEHGRVVPTACSIHEERYRSAMDQSVRLNHEEYAEFKETNTDHLLWPMYREIIEGQDDAICDDVLQTLAASNTYYVPTHLTRLGEALVHKGEYVSDPSTRTVPDTFLLGWVQEGEKYAGRFAETPGLEQDFYDFFTLGVELTVKANAAGVKVLIGTDNGDLMAPAGYGMHDEMWYLSEAGMPNADILKAATIRPAEYEGLDATHGSIAVGKKAAMMLLASNPLEDISAFDAIQAVYHQSRFYDQAARLALLDIAEYNAKGVRHYLGIGMFALRSIYQNVFASN
ncbi:MAG: amidohydrolase family protein [Pseudomonadota bacterium]